MGDFTAVTLRKIWGETKTALWQDRFAYDANGNVEYHGVAARGAASSAAAWFIEKFTYDANSQVTLIQTAPDDSIWDNRTTITYT